MGHLWAGKRIESPQAFGDPGRRATQLTYSTPPEQSSRGNDGEEVAGAERRSTELQGDCKPCWVSPVSEAGGRLVTGQLLLG